jgi:hypothetical protein
LNWTELNLIELNEMEISCNYEIFLEILHQYLYGDMPCKHWEVRESPGLCKKTQIGADECKQAQRGCWSERRRYSPISLQAAQAAAREICAAVNCARKVCTCALLSATKGARTRSQASLLAFQAIAALMAGIRE